MEEWKSFTKQFELLLQTNKKKLQHTNKHKSDSCFKD